MPTKNRNSPQERAKSRLNSTLSTFHQFRFWWAHFNWLRLHSIAQTCLLAAASTHFKWLSFKMNFPSTNGNLSRGFANNESLRIIKFHSSRKLQIEIEFRGAPSHYSILSPRSQWETFHCICSSHIWSRILESVQMEHKSHCLSRVSVLIHARRIPSVHVTENNCDRMHRSDEWDEQAAMKLKFKRTNREDCSDLEHNSPSREVFFELRLRLHEPHNSPKSLLMKISPILCSGFVFMPSLKAS